MSKGHPARWCINYRVDKSPLDSTLPDRCPPTCAAGVKYSDFDGNCFDRRPCFLDDKGQSKPNALQCPKIRRPTAQEILDYETWAAEQHEKHRVVMKAIVPWRAAWKGKSGCEKIDCPACGAKFGLSLRISRVNGHVHGHCSTIECVSWME